MNLYFCSGLILLFLLLVFIIMDWIGVEDIHFESHDD